MRANILNTANDLRSISRKSGFTFSSALNAEHLTKLYDDDIARALQMFELYLEVLAESLQELENLCNHKSYHELEASFHKLKDYFELVGLSTLEISAKSLEKKANDFGHNRSHNYALLSNAVSVFVGICERSNGIIETEIERMKYFLAD